MADEPGPYADSHWWQSHFSGIMLDLWHSILPAQQAARDADFLESQFQLPKGAKILDVPCGEGRVALELAARSYQLVGVDISAGLIQSARQQSRRRQLPIEWHEADMRSLPWEAAFDAAFCWGDSFGYMDDAANQAFLAAVHRALKPHGQFAMEMQMVAEVLMPRYREEQAGEAGGIHVRLQRKYDPQHGRLNAEYSLTRDGKEEKRIASYRIYTCSDICRMLEQAGFAVSKLLGGAGEPFQIGSDRLRLVATTRP